MEKNITTKNRKPKRRSNKYQNKSKENIRIARAHIAKLFEQAKLRSKDNLALSNRYVTLARKIAMKFKLRLPSEQKRLFCPHCYKFALPGKTVRVRIHDSKLIYSCQLCKKFWRRPLK